ncbi:MAG: hypothetical protein JOZ33_04025 [Acidobacteriaceae bacterium]|nr:hypothetical protein [Acidobacteriaceae bacterium]
MALGAPAAALAEGLQNQQQPPKVKPGQEPQPESQAAQKYPQQLGTFINRPLTQVSKAADALLDEMEGRGCDFFYNEASPKSGLVRDRAPAAGRSLSRVSSIAATGFGLSALCIAAKRNYLRPSDCEARVEKTLAFLLEECPHEHGFLYHFIDIESGQRMFGSELSSIDTALLLCGVLLCRQYFAGNTRIAALATTFYRRIDWQWMLNGGTTLSMGWLPDQGFLSHRWDIYSELMTMYLMAIGSPTHPIPAETWNALQRPVVQFGGIDYISGVAPLFIHQYAHAWCDYRDIRDLHANYFTNSIAATRTHQLWCLTLGKSFPWIDQDMWGITASDSRNGYRVWGGPPSMGPLDGTLVPCAAAGSLPFLPAECSHVLSSMRERMGDRIWTRYGFVDSFNSKTNWFATDILGINQGISVLMAENLRSGFAWQYFMKNREIVHAMNEVQFHPDPEANSQVL